MHQLFNSFQYPKASKKQAALFLKAAKKQIVEFLKIKIKEIQLRAALRQRFGWQRYGAGLRKYDFSSDRIFYNLSTRKRTPQTPKSIKGRKVLTRGDISFYENNELAEGLVVRFRGFGSVAYAESQNCIKFTKSEILSVGTYNSDWLIYEKLNHLQIKDFKEVYAFYWWNLFLANFRKLHKKTKTEIAHTNYRSYFLKFTI